MNTFDVSKDYNRDDYLSFLRDFLPDDYESDIEEIFYNYTNIAKGYKLGTVPSLNLDVFEFRTIKNRDPRVTLTKEAVSFMKKFTFNPNALVVFYSCSSHNWRLSLITTDYEIINDTVKSVYSNPRRFSFRLGAECKAHTPTVMLFNKGQVEDKDDLKSRFALEVVSKEFFDEYKVFYEDFVQFITGNRYVKTSGNKYEKKEIHKPNNPIFSQFLKLANNDVEAACKLVRDYIKKFMGRLVFLHFLQRKGWLGVEKGDAWGSGDKNFLFNLFSSSKYKADFLDKVLEPLFFGMLNTSEDSREELFKKKGWDLDLLKEFKRVPYLNGGLFEDDELDRLNMKFPKELFSNLALKDVTRTFNYRTLNEDTYQYTNSCGLLDFFNRYNFTIDETDPADMEIGVEPEMLGKIFENLLEDNKDKGAFYTPKEIVQYMCRESLIAYLLTDSKIEETRIRDLVLTHKVSFTALEIEELLKKIKEVKVCDPAVGSGAFPMGLLNELFACRVALGEKACAADIKKDIVRENIYGVDIEKGAVDIARLRFWLAIIVDEKEPIPLPNLDYKIMQGNSLLESYKGVDLSKLTESSGGLFDENEEVTALIEAIDGYFVPNDHIAKQKIRNMIEQKIIALLKARNYSKEEGLYENLSKLDMHANTEFFLWHTWFNDVFNRPNDRNGFDIVIGNPPYVEAKKLKTQSSDLKKHYKVYTGTADLSVYFMELALHILNPNGNMCYITTNKFFNTEFGKPLRKMILDETITHLINFEQVEVFENVLVSSVIIGITHKKVINNKFIYHQFYKLKKEQFKSEFVSKQGLFSTFGQMQLDETEWSFATGENAKLKQKLDAFPRIKDIEGIHVYRGVTTGYNPAFIIDNQQRNKLIKENPKSAEIIKNMLQGRNIRKWYYDESDENLLFIPWHFPLSINISGASKKAEDAFRKDYYSIYEWLLNHKSQLEERNKDETGIRYEWYALQRCAASYYKEFEKCEKIIWGLTSDKWAYALDTGRHYLPSNGYILTSDSLPIRFILGLLNSKVLHHYFKYIGVMTAGGAYTLKAATIEALPIPLATEKQHRAIITLVNQILEAKVANFNNDTNKFEAELDRLVYKLYDLTEKEIAIIEGSNN